MVDSVPDGVPYAAGAPPAVAAVIDRVQAAPARSARRWSRGSRACRPPPARSPHRPSRAHYPHPGRELSGSPGGRATWPDRAVACEVGDDPGNQRLERRAPAELLGVGLAIGHHDPPAVTGPVGEPDGERAVCVGRPAGHSGTWREAAPPRCLSRPAGWRPRRRGARHTGRVRSPGGRAGRAGRPGPGP